MFYKVNGSLNYMHIHTPGDDRKLILWSHYAMIARRAVHEGQSYAPRAHFRNPFYKCATVPVDALIRVKGKIGFTLRRSVDRSAVAPWKRTAIPENFT